MHNLTRSRNRKSVLVFWLILALLFAQGMRVCLHAHDATASDHEHNSAMHVESTLSAAVDHEESAFDADVSLPALLKAFYSSLAFAVVLVFSLLAPILLQRVWRRPSIEVWFPVSPLYSLTPPLRAPPR